MNHDRLRVCLKSALLFAIPIGLLAVFAQASGSHPENHPDSILVFAPHPDDEVIGCAGIIMQALARGARVKVVAITSGDGFPAAAAGVPHKRVDQVGLMIFLALSRLRQTESRTALEILGGKADDLILLGYPDGDLGNLYENTNDKIIRQQFTKKNDTYALIKKDYHSSVYGKPAPYRSSYVLDDLVELMTTLQPTEIYVTDEPMVTSTIARHSGLSGTQRNRWDTKGPFIRTSSTDYQPGLFRPGSRRTSHLSREKLVAKWLRELSHGRRRDASRLHLSRRSGN